MTILIISSYSYLSSMISSHYRKLVFNRAPNEIHEIFKKNTDDPKTKET